ncbi:hypothetical protein ACKAV7_008656 [Fusarium commune]
MTEQGHACRADSTDNIEGLGFEEHAIVGNLRFDVPYTNGLQESLFQVFMPPVFVGQMRSLISEMCCRMYASDFLVKGIHHEGDEARFVVNRTIKFGEHPVPKAMQVAFQVNKTLLNLAKVALDVLLDIKEASVEDVEGLDVHVIKHAGLVEAAAVFKNLDFEFRNAIIHIAEFLTYEVHNSLHHGLNLPIVWRVRLKARSWRDAALTLPIEEAAPDEFAKYVYKSLPHWIGKYPAQDFVKLKFNLWDIPSREQVANMLELLDIGAFVWDLAATWHYAPVSFYDQVGKDVPQDRRSLEFERPDGLLEHFTTRCREKLRFSATAAAI